LDAQYATVSKLARGAGIVKRCLWKIAMSTIPRNRRLAVNAREVHYPSPVAVRQWILSHHLSSGSAAAVHDSRRIHAHSGGPVGIWHRPDGLRVLDLGRYTSGVYNAVHCLRVKSRSPTMKSLTCQAFHTSQLFGQQENLYLQHRTRLSDETELGRLRSRFDQQLR
jgi:hypothetical protein